MDRAGELTLRARPARARRVVVPIALFCTGSLVLAACGSTSAGPSSAGGGGTVNVGVTDDFNTFVGDFATGELQGVELEMDQVNSSGGLLGSNVKVLKEGTNLTNSTAEQVTRSLILDDHVKALWGPVSSGEAAVQEPLAAQYNVPIFFSTANDIGLTTPSSVSSSGSYVSQAFEMVDNTDMEPAAAALAFKNLTGPGPIRLATITPNYSFGLDTVSAFLKDLKADGVSYTITTQQTPALLASTFVPQLNAVLASNPQYVFVGEYGGDLVTLTKEAEQLGLFNSAKVGAMYDYDVLQSLGSSAPAGAIAWDRFPFWPVSTPAMNSFVSAYDAKFGTYPNEWAVTAYESAQAWVWAVKKAGTFDTAKVVAALSGATVPNTVAGNITVRSCDHQLQTTEWTGIVSSAPDPKYGVTLWSDTYDAPFSQIGNSCPSGS